MFLDGWCRDLANRDVSQRSSQGISCRDLAQRSFLQILYRSCTGISYSDVAKGFFLEVSYKDFEKRSIAEILPQGLSAKGFLAESLNRYPFLEMSYKEFAWRSLIEIVRRDRF